MLVEPVYVNGHIFLFNYLSCQMKKSNFQQFSRRRRQQHHSTKLNNAFDPLQTNQISLKYSIIYQIIWFDTDTNNPIENMKI